MSFAAYKLMHSPTGIENCASGFITHSRADFVPRIPPIQTDDLESEWPTRHRDIGPIPNLIVTAANVLEVYIVRVQEESTKESKGHVESKRGALMDGISGASLELACHYRFAPSVYSCWRVSLLNWLIHLCFFTSVYSRLHGNVETMAVLSIGGGDASRRRDSIILTFKDAKISVLEYDDSVHGLRIRWGGILNRHMKYIWTWILLLKVKFWFVDWNFEASLGRITYRKEYLWNWNDENGKHSDWTWLDRIRCICNWNFLMGPLWKCQSLLGTREMFLEPNSPDLTLHSFSIDNTTSN